MEWCLVNKVAQQLFASWSHAYVQPVHHIAEQQRRVTLSTDPRVFALRDHVMQADWPQYLRILYLFQPVILATRARCDYRTMWVQQDSD